MVINDKINGFACKDTHYFIINQAFPQKSYSNVYTQSCRISADCGLTVVRRPKIFSVESSLISPSLHTTVYMALGISTVTNSRLGLRITMMLRQSSRPA